MDPHTREAIGRLARWIVLPGAVVLSVVAVATQMGALTHTVSASRSWSVTPDVLSRSKGILALRVYSNAPLRAIGKGFYWYGPDGQLSDPGFDRGITYYRIPAGTPSGIFPIHNVVNPYARYAPGSGRAAAYLYPKGTQVVVLDARSILPVTEYGRLAGDARRLWADRASSIPLVQLAESRRLAYLVPVPLADYDRARDILRQAPTGAVVSAGHQYDIPPGVEQIADQLAEISRRMGARPILLTEDVDLASHVRSTTFPVVLIGSDAPSPSPSRGANVRDWASALAFLTE